MKTLKTLFTLLLSCLVVTSPATPQISGSVERMYVFNCGEITIKDISHWSPGVNAGKPFEFSNHELFASTKAELWMNHDKAQSARIPKAPQYVE